jgi:NAD/NADP transhydrogenase alpha subunit
MPITIGALREITPHETRVALVPEVAAKFADAGARVLIERGAGDAAQFGDALYKKVEWADAATVLSQADVLLTVRPPSLAQIAQLKPGAVVAGYGIILLAAHASDHHDRSRHVGWEDRDPSNGPQIRRYDATRDVQVVEKTRSV